MLLKKRYFVNYEVWQNGKCTKWGNCEIVTSDKSQVTRSARAEGARIFGCNENDVRVIGVFKL